MAFIKYHPVSLGQKSRYILTGSPRLKIRVLIETIESHLTVRVCFQTLWVFPEFWILELTPLFPLFDGWRYPVFLKPAFRPWTHSPYITGQADSSRPVESNHCYLEPSGDSPVKSIKFFCMNSRSTGRKRTMVYLCKVLYHCSPILRAIAAHGRGSCSHSIAGE